MKITSHHLSLILIAILLLATGFTISHIHTPPTASKSSTPAAQHSQSRSSQDPTTTELRQRLTSIDNQSGPDRLLRLIAIIERSTLDTLPGLARHFVHDEPILKIIALHWFNLDPHHGLQTLLENRHNDSFPSETLNYFFMENWLAQDFAGLVQAIDELPLEDRKWWGFTDMYCDIADLDYKTGLRLMREAQQIDISPNSQQITQLATENPRKIADDVRQLTNRIALIHALQQIGAEWGKSKPEEALTYALAIPGHPGKHMSSAALTSWATLEPEAAATWLTSQQNSRIQDQLRPALLKAWQKKDPEAAHEYCLTNLTGFRQRQALRSIETAPAPD